MANAFVLFFIFLILREKPVVRFELLNPLTDEAHHAGGDIIHRTGDLDRSLLF
jgi:hypothetical protein